MMNMLYIIGGGPAGLMAAIVAARTNVAVTLLERGPAAARKLLLTGGGRCNLTHEGTIAEFVKACHPCGNSLKPAFYTFSPHDLIEFFDKHGLKTVAEANHCVFPSAGGAADVARILVHQAKASGVEILANHQVTDIQYSPGSFLIQAQKHNFTCSALVVATGGISYPQTGSTGDGLAWAKAMGHSIVPPIGILCPIVCRETWLGSLQGISLDRMGIQVKNGTKGMSCSGAAVFTANGIGGPAAFDVSRASADAIRHGRAVAASIDLCPLISRASLESNWLKICTDHPRKELVSILTEYLPRRISELLVRMAGLQPDAQGSQLNRQDRQRLLNLLKEIPITITGHAPVEKATVTGGGVDRKEIDFKTMQSRICPGLFFAGEVIDVDGPCGGYNLQIAFSTGALAGQSAAAYVGSTSR